VDSQRVEESGIICRKIYFKMHKKSGFSKSQSVYNNLEEKSILTSLKWARILDSFWCILCNSCKKSGNFMEGCTITQPHSNQW